MVSRSTGLCSRAQRCNVLVYAMDGADYVLVASKGGADRSPGWF
jgi:hypothetical protein